MKIPVRVVGLGALLVFGAAGACYIENPEAIHLGAMRGERGVCSNSGEAVECTFQHGEGWTCNGPEGEYTGFDKDVVVAQACGC